MGAARHGRAGRAWLGAEDGKHIAKGSGERESWGELIIPWRLRDAIARINPELPASAVDEAVELVLTATSRDALAENQRMHEFLTRGIRCVTYTDEYGAEQNPTIWLHRPAGPREQRLHGRAPGDGGGRGAPAAVRRRAVRQRDAARRSSS